MELWKIWLIGVAIAIIARVAVTMIYEKKRWTNVSEFTEVMVQLLITISIVIVIGMPISEFLKLFLDIPTLVLILLVAITSILIYRVAYLVLGLYNFKSILLKALYAFTFIISIIAFIIPTIEYDRNIKEITEKVVEQTEERVLIEFDEMSIKEATNAAYEDLKNTKVKGILDYFTPLDMVSYSYMGKNNENIVDTALVKNTQIVYIEKWQTPYVEIISYYMYTKLIDNRTGEETIKQGSEQRWETYTFYLPIEMMYYMSQLS